MQAILGIAVLLLFAWLVSESRAHVRWRPVAIGLALQFVLAVTLLRIPAVGDTLLLVNEVVYAVERATAAGTGFVFGYLGGDAPPFDVSTPGALYIFAFRVLPQIIVFSVLVAVLWYWRVLPLVIGAFGALLRRALGLRGAVGTAAAAPRRHPAGKGPECRLFATFREVTCSASASPSCQTRRCRASSS